MPSIEIATSAGNAGYAEVSTTNPLPTTATPPTGTSFALTGAATTNATLVKNSAGALHDLSIHNITASPAYFRLYNLSVAPTVGTSAPLMTYVVAAGTTLQVQFGHLGKRFSTGISYAITSANVTNLDATAIGTAGILVSGTYA